MVLTCLVIAIVLWAATVALGFYVLPVVADQLLAALRLLGGRDDR